MFHLLAGGGGVEIRCHGFGPHPALRLHGRVHHRDGGCLCWEAHRAQHAVELKHQEGESREVDQGASGGVHLFPPVCTGA